MYLANRNKHGIARRAVASALTIALVAVPVGATVTPAFAATSTQLQAQLDEANARLDQLYAAAEQAEAELGKANWELEQTRERIGQLEDEIAQNQELLNEKQGMLSQQVVTSYKDGNTSILDVILESTSFDDFVSRITYANKVNELYVNTITEVRELRESLNADKEELEVRESDQEQQVSLQEQKLVAMEAAQAQQAEYINNLSDELRAAIEEERRKAAEEAARRAAEAQAREAAEQAAREQAAREQAQQQQQQEQQQTSTPTESTPSSTDTGSTSDYSDYSDYSEPSTTTYTPSTPTYVAPTPSVATGDQRSTAVNAALSQVGLPYLWGEGIPGVGFDCNSLTHWAWQQAGVEIPYTSGHYSYGQFQWMQSSGRWVTSRDALQPGDLVFYSYDGGATTYHVAMYIGGGQVVHANGYRWGVMVSDIDFDEGFCGGGSPI